MSNELGSGIRLFLEDYCGVLSSDSLLLVFNDSVPATVRAALSEEGLKLADRTTTLEAPPEFDQALTHLNNSTVVIFLEGEKSTYSKEIRQHKLLTDGL